MKACPACGEQIQDVAKLCRYCGEILDPSVEKVRKRKRGDTHIGWRVVFALVWAVVLYFGICMAAGFVIGARTGAENPGNPNLQELVRQRVESTLTPLRGYIFLGSAVVAGLGAWARILPGTLRRDR